MKIVAIGTFLGEKQTIVFEDGEFETENLWLDSLLENPQPIGGTYYPEKYDPLNVYFTLKDRYFDKLTSIEVEGELGTIPFEEGTIY